MTIREFCKKWYPRCEITVAYQDTVVARFNSDFWHAIDRSILDLEIRSFSDLAERGHEMALEIMAETGRPIYASSREGLQKLMDDPSVTDIALAADIEAVDDTGAFNDVTPTIILRNGAQKTLNLNGHIIGALDNWQSGASAAVCVTDGTLTIFGKGRVDGGTGSANNVAVWANGDASEIIIRDGIYDVGLDASEGVNSTIYASDKGKIEICGGFFESRGGRATSDYRYILNIQNDSGSHIYCSGGDFWNQNPANGDDEDATTGKTFVADGYTVEEYIIDVQETIYKVVQI